MSNAASKNQHEEFLIEDSNKKGRIKLVRQDRKDVSGANCFLEANSSKSRIINISNFGILIESEQSFDILPKEGLVVVNNVELGNFTFELAREFNKNGKHYYALEAVGDIIHTEQIDTILSAQDIIKSHTEFRAQNAKIPDIFARKVYEIKDWLEELQSQLKKVEDERPLGSAGTPASDDVMARVIGGYINDFFPIENSHWESIFNSIDKESKVDCYNFLREKLYELIYQAPFPHRVYHKPRGYAGDYEMMNIIYQSKNDGHNLFAKCMQYYSVQQPGAQAVRNRANYLIGKIGDFIENSSKNSLDFLSVACGPAKEWQTLANKDFNKTLNVSLLDQDEDALKHTQRKIREVVAGDKVNFEFNHKSIKNIIVRGIPDQYDFIYSAGLFDYFSAPVAKMAAQKLYESLKPGGKLVIGNFNIENPNSLSMDLFLDWHLIYRSTEELYQLFDIPGARVTVEQEELNINLFCVIEKP